MSKYNDLVRTVLSFFENNAHMNKEEFYFIIEKVLNEKRYTVKEKAYEKKELLEHIAVLKKNIKLLSNELSNNIKK